MPPFFQPECRLCKKTFKQLYTLKIHMNIHRGHRPYVCHVCGYSCHSPQVQYTHRYRFTALFDPLHIICKRGLEHDTKHPQILNFKKNTEGDSEFSDVATEPEPWAGNAGNPAAVSLPAAPQYYPGTPASFSLYIFLSFIFLSFFLLSFFLLSFYLFCYLPFIFLFLSMLES